MLPATPLILHVEDSPGARYVRRRELEAAGFAVIESDTVEHSRTLLESTEPDVLLVDIRLPDGDGFALTTALKANPATAATPIILVSSFFTDPAFRIKGLDAGADAYLMDPLAAGELAATVRAVLRRRDVERERAAALDALTEVEYRYGVAFEQEAVGMAEVSLDGRYLHVNRRLASMLGYTPEELKGMRFTRFTDPPDLQADLDDFARLFRGDITRTAVEKRMRRRDGALLSVHVLRVLLRDGAGAPRACLAVFVDLTEVLTARADARQAYTVLETAARYLPGGSINVFDRDLRYVYAAGRGLATAGLDPGAMVGRTIGELFGAEGLAMVEPHYRRALAGETVEFELTVGGRTYQLQAAPLELPDREADRIVVLALDITTRKAAEEVLRDADRRKDAFVATLVHELRQPLASIETAAGLLQKPVAPEVAGRARSVIERQAGVLRRLVDDVVDATRVVRGKIELKTTLLDLREAIDDVLHVVAPMIGDRGVRFAVDVPADPVWIKGDRQRLQQVFSNLLTNALTHTPRDGRVEVRVLAEDGRAEIVIADSGRGIPPELLPHVFELFVQGSPSAAGGLGIGLAVVRGIVELHGGDVRAASQGLGFGTQFTVSLPLETGAV